jgi:hypothetical protein
MTPPPADESTEQSADDTSPAERAEAAAERAEAAAERAEAAVADGSPSKDQDEQHQPGVSDIDENSMPQDVRERVRDDAAREQPDREPEPDAADIEDTADTEDSESADAESAGAEPPDPEQADSDRTDADHGGESEADTSTK